MVGVGNAARVTLVAGGLLTAAALVLGASGVLAGQRAVVAILPQVLGALALVLAWRFRRHRLAVAAILLAATAAVLPGAPGGDPTRTALAVAVAADLALLAALRSRPVWRPGTAVWVGVVGLQVWWAAAGVHHPALEPLCAWLERPGLAEGVLLAGGLAVLVALAVRRGALEAALAWSTVLVSLALLGGRDPHQAALLLTAGQLGLLVSAAEDSYRLAYHDQLTGLPGRRALEEAMVGLARPFAIAMADVDHFKRFNDRYGHAAGDQVLRMVADELARVGGGGRAFRYGGEEFAILFPGTRVVDVRDELETVRRAIAERRFALRAPDRPRAKPDKPRTSATPTRRVTVTVSLGAADATSRRPTTEAVLRAADKALYRAKRAGRNRVVAAGDRL
jgi:diguanylate cyclase (GGDEF)-like protein